MTVGQSEAEKCLHVALTDNQVLMITDNRPNPQVTPGPCAIQMVQILGPGLKVGAKPQGLLPLFECYLLIQHAFSEDFNSIPQINTTNLTNKLPENKIIFAQFSRKIGIVRNMVKYNNFCYFFNCYPPPPPPDTTCNFRRLTLYSTN